MGTGNRCSFLGLDVSGILSSVGPVPGLRPCQNNSIGCWELEQTSFFCFLKLTFSPKLLGSWKWGDGYTTLRMYVMPLNAT